MFLVAGMLPLGLAMNNSGTAALLGRGLVNFLGGAGPLAVVAGLYCADHSADANDAWGRRCHHRAGAGGHPDGGRPASMGADPRAMALAVALGCSTAFITPISHASNLLVMGPGGYTFRDYARLGLPLTGLLFVVMLAGLPLWWGLR